MAISCDGAALSQGVIWPPDHTMVAETIWGVTSSLMGVTVVITSIYQDEPVNALGSGNTAPDGSGVGTPTAYVRVERSGLGTGRIYIIAFTAMDAGGNQRHAVGERPARPGTGICPDRHAAAIRLDRASPLILS